MQHQSKLLIHLLTLLSLTVVSLAAVAVLTAKPVLKVLNQSLMP